MAAHAFTMADKLSLGRAFSALMRPVPSNSTRVLGAWLKRNGQTQGALDRFWRLVIASALNAEIDSHRAALCGQGDPRTVHELGLAGSMGMSTLPLSQLYAGAEPFLEYSGSSVHLNTNVESAEWDDERAQWTLRRATAL